MPVAEQLVAVAALPGGSGFALADEERARIVDTSALPEARWVWWRAASTAPALLAQGVRPRACWDLGAVHRLLTGDRRDDPAAVFAAGGGAAEPPRAPAEPSLFDLVADPDPVRPDGSLSPDWAREQWSGAARGPDPLRWAALALDVQRAQSDALARLPDPRVHPTGLPLPRLTALAESAAALLAVELERDGLPVDRPALETLLCASVGPRPDDDGESSRRARDELVRRHLPGGVDLRNPLQVRAALARLGIDVPDTRSWRLEPHRGTSQAVAALLDWRRTERIATTYGWSWLERSVGADDRLRGSWGAADAAAGRMTASAGLHNLPADLRPAIAARPGHVIVRADLGQIEPRVLAVVSGDAQLAAAAREPDMYAPVAAQLGCDRPTAKVAVLAAMYGQTTGTAGAALRRMTETYPQALEHLRRAEEIGRAGGELRTWGGRLLRSAGGGSGRFLRNAVVQGAAAELFKVWAVTVRAGLPDVGGEIVLCLHDELLLHVPAASAGSAVALLHRSLEQAAGSWAAGSGVRFGADVAVVQRWSDAKA